RRGRRWVTLPQMPAPRAAAGAAILNGKLYVVGGVEAPGRLATDAFAYDLARGRWSLAAGPRPREHLGAAALGNTIYAVAGRTSGLDSNLDLVEAYARPANPPRPPPPPGAADPTRGGPPGRNRRRRGRGPARLGGRRGAGRHDPHGLRLQPV